MKESALAYMHHLLAESLYRGYSGERPDHAEATNLAALSVRWFRQLLLRLSIQGCIEEANPSAGEMADPREFLAAAQPDSHCLEAIQSRDEALWEALCDGRLVLRVEDSKVEASVVPRTPDRVMH